MKKEIKTIIENFVFHYDYIPEDTIIWIGLELCKKYGWDTDQISRRQTRFDPVEHCEYDDVVHDYKKAWEFVLRAAREKRDLYALATLLFYRVYKVDVEESGYYVTNESVLLEMIEILENLEDKTPFACFLLGRAYYNQRGMEDTNDDKMAYYFEKAAEGGYEIGKAYVYYVLEDYENLFSIASRLIVEFPQDHVLKFFLGYCYYYGFGTEKNYDKVIEFVGYTAKINANRNSDPVDYYFLKSRYILGLCYFHGYGVEKDISTAYTLFRFASASYLPQSYYCQAIAYLLKDEAKNPGYVWELIHDSAINYYAPALRKAMLCIRSGYGTERDQEQYMNYMELYEMCKEHHSEVSDLGYEADHCDLINHKNEIIVDDEVD